MQPLEKRIGKRLLWQFLGLTVAAGLYICFHWKDGPSKEQKKLDDASMDQAVKMVKSFRAQGQPMTISGTTDDGTAVTTADWNGKVVLVYFGAGSPGSSVTDLPLVERFYADNHAKGLEVLGIRGGATIEPATRPADTPPWPLLADNQPDPATGVTHHPIADRYGIDDFNPMIFLIDKKGICRTAYGREQADKLLPQLLAE